MKRRGEPLRVRLFCCGRWDWREMGAGAGGEERRGNGTGAEARRSPHCRAGRSDVAAGEMLGGQNTPGAQGGIAGHGPRSPRPRCRKKEPGTPGPGAVFAGVLFGGGGQRPQTKKSRGPPREEKAPAFHHGRGAPCGASAQPLIFSLRMRKASSTPPGSVPPAWAWSGRPPPEPCMAAATSLMRAGAVKRSCRSLET